MDFTHKSFAVLVFLLLLAGATPTAVAATAYYISVSGDDSWSGLSPENAWRTVKKVNRLNLGPGDRVLFEGGQTFFGPLEFDEHDRGTADSAIEIGSYQTTENGRARIFAGRGTGIHVHNTSGLSIQDLDIVGDGLHVNQSSGIVIYNTARTRASHIRISNVDISGFGIHGISLGAWKTKVGYHDVRITNSHLHDNLRTGIMTWGQWGPDIYAHTEVYVARCHAYRMKGGSGITLSSVNGGVVEKCVARHNGSDFSGAAGIWAWDSNDILFQFNESHHNQTTEADGDGFDFDGGVTNSVMQYNYSHDNDAAGYLLAQYQGAPAAMRNITIRYNISENDCRKKGYGAIHIWNGDQPDRLGNVQIYNNTVYLSPSPGDEPSAFAIVSPTLSVQVLNNLFIATGGKPLVHVVPEQEALRLQNNAYWSGNDAFHVNWKGRRYASLSAWLHAARNQERSGGIILAVYADPLLANPGAVGTLDKADRLDALAAYKLLPESPLLRRGINVLDMFGIDPGKHGFFGTPISLSSRPSIGAHVASNEP